MLTGLTAAAIIGLGRWHPTPSAPPAITECQLAQDRSDAVAHDPSATRDDLTAAFDDLLAACTP